MSKLWRHCAICAAVVGFALASTGSASVGVAMEDDFSDGTLDPAWNVSFEYADGWTYEESGGELRVTDISATYLNDYGREKHWSYVNLTRSVGRLDDFEIDVNISWDSEGTETAIQRLMVVARAADGSRIASCFYQDAWYESGGTFSGAVGDHEFYGPIDSLPLAGTGVVDINRSGGDVDVLINGVPMIDGSMSSPMTDIELRFGFLNHTRGSTFGTETIDIVTVIPEPMTVGLVAIGGLALLRRRPR